MFREGLLPYWWLLYCHSKLLGQGTDIFRNIEDAFALKHGELHLKPGGVYVDIGSGSSPVPTLLHQRCRAKTYATEMDRVYLNRQRDYAKALGLGKGDDFFTQREDATQLSFADGTVDFLTAVSTIEHIPGDGDTHSMIEFARVLRPGGRLVVTVPTDTRYVENQSTFYYHGFERRYDPEALSRRLFRPDLRPVEQLYMVSPPEEFVQDFQRQFRETLRGENAIELWYKSGWHTQYADVSILITLALVRLSPDPAGSFGACLAFEKHG